MTSLVEAMCKAIGAGPEALHCEHDWSETDPTICLRCGVTPEEAIDLLRAALDLEQAQSNILKSTVAILSRDNAALLANLTHVQNRGRDLLEETRELSARVRNRDEIAGLLEVERDEAIAQRDAFGQKAHRLQEEVWTQREKIRNFDEISESCDRVESALREEVRDLRVAAGGILLPGWTCPKCSGFNSDAKERLTTCRACETPRPT